MGEAQVRWHPSVIAAPGDPGPDRRWQEHAACRGLGPGGFFPPEEDGEQVDEALTVCGACSVRDQCLAYALRAKETYGVWGGTTPKERRRLRRLARRKTA